MQALEMCSIDCLWSCADTRAVDAHTVQRQFVDNDVREALEVCFIRAGAEETYFTQLTMQSIIPITLLIRVHLNATLPSPRLSFYPAQLSSPSELRPSRAPYYHPPFSPHC